MSEKQQEFRDAVRARGKLKPKKPKLKQAPRPFAPRTAERTYIRDLRAVVASLRKQFKVHALELWPQIQREVATERPRLDDSVSIAKRLMAGIDVWFAQNWTQPELERLAERMTTSVDTVVKRSIDEQWKRVLGVNPMQSDRGMEKFLQARVRENVSLITSLPERTFPYLEQGFLQGALRGERWENVSRYIEERFDVMESSAELIARDQTLKIYGAITEYRQQSLGVTEYEWNTSGDERVRPSHAALQGKVFAWDDPPSVGHPGQDFQCRCVAIPKIPE